MTTAVRKTTFKRGGHFEMTFRRDVLAKLTDDLPERIMLAFGELFLEAAVKRAPHGQGSHHGPAGGRTFGGAIAGGGSAGGTLRRSLDTELKRVSKGFQGMLFGTCGYSGFVEIGTGLYGPHHTPIVPKRKKFLAWEDPYGGWIFARQVRGRPATPYIKPAFDSTVKKLDSIANKEWKRLERETRE